jgi:hypothetical protein
MGGNGILINQYKQWLIGLGIPYGLSDTAGTVFRDEFNRPEEALETSANWTRLSGNAGYGRVYTGALWTAGTTALPAVYLSPDMGSSDHWTELVYRVAGTANNRVALRLTDVSNCIWFSLTSSTTLTINKLVAGANTVVATYTLSSLPVAGDRFQIGVVGTTLTVKRNGVTITAATTPSTVAGVPLSTRQGFIARARAEICRRYATGV